MTSDLDIYRAAAILIKDHGEDAPFQAGMRMDEMLDRGDPHGVAVWLRVLMAAKGLLAEEPEGTVH